MKKKLGIFPIVLLMVGLATWSCTSENNCYLSEITYSGGAVSQFSYENGRLMKVTNYGSDGYLSNNLQIYRDTEGKIIRVDDVLPNGWLYARYLCTYNIQGKLGEVYLMFDDDHDGNAELFFSRTSYTYVNNELTNLTSYNLSSVVLQSTNLTWQNGNLTGVDNTLTNTQHYYSYDSGKSVASTISDLYFIILPASSLISKNNMTQDDYYSGGTLISTFNYTTSYDAEGYPVLRNGAEIYTWDCN
jgi:hypothetical protein